MTEEEMRQHDQICYLWAAYFDGENAAAGTDRDRAWQHSGVYLAAYNRGLNGEPPDITDIDTSNDPRRLKG